MAFLTFTNSGFQTIGDNALVISSLDVYGIRPTYIIGVSLYLRLSHEHPDDLDMLLVAPNGTDNALFWSDAGGSGDVSADFTITYSGTTALPDSGPFTTLSYSPFDYDPTETDQQFGTNTGGINHDSSALYTEVLSTTQPNGSWTLYIKDDASGQAGSLGEWSMTLETNGEPNIIGTFGNDTILIAGARNGAYVVNSLAPVTYTGVSYFEVKGDQGNDLVYGSSLRDFIEPGRDRDEVHASAGEDQIYIAAADDAVGEIIDGGADRDLVFLRDFSGAAALSVNLADDTLKSIEGLYFQYIAPTSSVKVLMAASQFGSSLFNPGFVDTGTIAGQAGATAEILDISMGTVTTFSLIGATFQDFNDPSDKVLIKGDGDAETIFGSMVSDYIDGGGNADTMKGWKGNDFYYVDNAGDIVDETLFTSDGRDMVISNNVSIDLSNAARFKGDIEDVQLTGAVALNITGNGLANTLTGTSGANLIDGGANNDLMRGVGGSDTYVVDSLADVVDELVAGSNGLDVVKSSTISIDLSNTTRFRGAVERIVLEGNGALNATGNALDNLITGNGGSNIIDGKGGGDVMRGVGGSDIYVVDSANDIVSESLAGSNGVDTVKSSLISIDFTDTAHFTGAVERITLEGSLAINARGNALDNLITGNGGANLIEGRGGADVMRGLGGSDSFVFSLAADSGLGALRDTINDFEDVGDNDTLDLSGFAGTLSYIGDALFTAANQVRASQFGAHVLVEINTVGVAGAESEILLTNTAIGQIDVGDFIV